MIKHSRRLAVAALLVGARLGAQQADSCEAVPGKVFGIRAISCSSCEIRSDADGRRIMHFLAEPVVLEVQPGASVVVGDIVETVNGQPITTAAGGERFSYPAVGSNQLTVRRGRDRHDVSAVVSAGACTRGAGSLAAQYDSLLARVNARLQELSRRSPQANLLSKDDSVSALVKAIVMRLDSLSAKRSAPPSSPRSSPMIVVDGVVVDRGSPMAELDAPSTGGYGFAVACSPSCTPATAAEGKTTFTYYRYAGTPPIIAVRAGGPASRAGVKVGDVILKVDGIPITDDAAGIRLWSVYRKDELRLTVLHGGKEVSYVLKVP